MEIEMVVFDTETTGLLLPDNAPLCDQPKIIEFFGTRINKKFEIIDEFETFINPGEPISEVINKITGIKDADVVDAPRFSDVAPNINKLFNGADLAIAHNIGFDNGMLKNEFLRVDVEQDRAIHDLCTVDCLIPHYGYRISLSALYKKLYGKYFKAHRAKSDVYALVSCFHKLIEEGVIDLELYQDGV